VDKVDVVFVGVHVFKGIEYYEHLQILDHAVQLIQLVQHDDVVQFVCKLEQVHLEVFGGRLLQVLHHVLDGGEPHRVADEHLVAEGGADPIDFEGAEVVLVQQLDVAARPFEVQLCLQVEFGYQGVSQNEVECVVFEFVDGVDLDEVVDLFVERTDFLLEDHVVAVGHAQLESILQFDGLLGLAGVGALLAEHLQFLLLVEVGLVEH